MMVVVAALGCGISVYFSANNFSMRLVVVILLLFPIWSFSQVTQSIIGTVVDSESQFPLPGVTIQLVTDSAVTATDINGTFELSNVSVGRHKLIFSFIGYQERVMDNVIVNSARETVVSLTLEEMVMEIEAAEVTATRNGEARNDMATVSARQFDVIETDRYAGSRGDPARMASNFAGVSGADDSRNDIVIRGNSPQGVLWRLDGIDMPNPNHFSIPGTGGGPVTILNNKILGNSDFYTGAFPAEFGNSVSGVFDLRMRNGNARKHQFSGQFGFLGTELLAEGPINKNKGSSYLGNFRYSTLSMFSALGIDIGTSAVPLYSDGFFRANFPRKTGGQMAIWGMGGKSAVDIVISDQVTPERNIFGENDRDQYFRSQMGIVGLTASKAHNENLFIRQSFAVAHERQNSNHELVYRHLNIDNQYINDSLVDLLNYQFEQNKASYSFYLNNKVNKNFSVKAGIIADGYMWNYFDEVFNVDTTSADYYNWDNRWNAQEGALFLQSFIQGRYRPNDDWTFVAGLHSQYFSLNGSASWIEPRVGVKRALPNGQTLSFGAGMHSQMQPTYMYFYHQQEDEFGNPIHHNRNMGFTRSNHYVLAYDRPLGKSMRLKAETYYQDLSEIPVEVSSSSFSIVNTGAGFSRFFPDSLENSGTGANYGVELTVEKFFANQYFFMLTASIYDSKYVGSDGVERNTDYNGGYTFNALGSKEWTINETASIVTGLKVTRAGGKRYGPVDIEASNAARDVVYVDSERNSQQFDDYFRVDLKVNYKSNRPKVTHEIGLDLVNITGQENVLKLTYAPDESNDPEKSVREEYQLGFLPVFYYKLDF